MKEKYLVSYIQLLSCLHYIIAEVDISLTTKLSISNYYKYERRTEYTVIDAIAQCY